MSRGESVMIQCELLRDRGILMVAPEGPLEANDFKQVAALVDPWIAENGALKGLMIRAPTFPGWESFGGLLAHLRFVRDHHRHIERVAAVTDSAFLKIAPLIAQHFADPEIRVFGSDEGAHAMTWLETGTA
jgi:hypothetical protein